MDNMQDIRQNELEQNAIMTIQTYLRQLSFHNEDIPPVPLDGIYESETRRSVIAFQNANDLSPTGIVDRETFERLREEYERMAALNSPPARIDVFPRTPRDYTLAVGEQGYLSVIIQHMLDELERVYRFPELSDSGIYDEINAANVREFQARNKIPVTGEVDRETWDAMALQYNLLESE